MLPPSATAIRIVLFALFVVSIWQLAALVERHAPPPAAWVAAVVYGFAASSPLLQGGDPNTEQFALPAMIAFVDLADRAALRGGVALAAGAGAALALSTGLKLTYVLIALPLLPLLLRGARPAATIVGLAGAAIATSAALVLPFVLAGAFDEMLDGIINYNREYGRAGFDAIFNAGPRQTAVYFVNFPGEALAVGGIVLGIVAWRLRESQRLVLLMAGWALVAYVIARSSGHSFAHYWIPAVPPLAVLIGVGVAALGRRAPAIAPAIAATVIAILAASLVLAPLRNTFAYPAGERWGDKPAPALSQVDEAAEIVKRLTTREDPIYVASGGATNAGQAIYWIADRRPASEHLYPTDEVTPAVAETAAQLRETPPALLIVMPDVSEDYPFVGPIIDDLRMREVASLESRNDAYEIRVFARPDIAREAQSGED